MIIAIDGPAGSGKSTIAREVAKRLGLRYLDSGAMYRAVTLLALGAGLVPDRLEEAAALAKEANLRLEERPDDLTRVFVGAREITDEIRTPLVSQNVSVVSAVPDVRRVLTQRQRAEAAAGDVVLEGRDIGTVVCPDADVKVFLTASMHERARRRQVQLAEKGITQDLDQLKNEIAYRDDYDSGRPVAPLCKAADAIEIDTSRLSIEQVVAAVCELVAKHGRLCPAEPAANETDAASSGRGRSTEPASPAIQPLRRLPRLFMVRSHGDTFVYRWFGYKIIPWSFRLFFRMEITGWRNIPLSGPVVLASTHHSNIDPFFLGAACPRQVHFMAKSELWKVKILGRLLTALGTFPVARGQADRHAVKQALDVLDKDSILGIFPEGHRQPPGQLGEINPGVSLFSLRRGVVTIPAVVRGTDRVVRHGILHFPRVRIVFGPPLEIPGVDVPKAERAHITTERLRQAVRDLTRESEND
jgi:CMP/dCMP kinase